MKNYFCKYLPVEGIGDKNCKWEWYNNIQNTGWEDIAPSDIDGIIAYGLNPSPKFRKLKLFLCSKDVKIGDVIPEFGKVVNKKLYGFLNEERKFIECTKAFKIIGEISEDAIFVKEGDEISEDRTIGWNSKFDISQKMDIQPDKDTDFIKIKCPCCNTFK